MRLPGQSRWAAGLLVHGALAGRQVGKEDPVISGPRSALSGTKQ